MKYVTGMEPEVHPVRYLSRSYIRYLVPGEGLEPTKISPEDFKSSASANSAIPATKR